MKKPNEKKIPKGSIVTGVSSSVPDEFEDNVMDAVYKIVLERKVKRDRMMSIVFILLGCTAISSFLIISPKIGRDVLPTMDKGFFLFVQDVMIFVIMLLVHNLIRSSTLKKNHFENEPLGYSK